MWSAWPWVKTTASRRVMPSRKACVRKSGVVSITTARPSYSSRMEGRSALVVRVGRCADGALAGEDGHPRGSSGAEKLESHHPLRACRFCNSTNVIRSS